MRFLEFLGRQAIYFINKMRVIQRSPSAYCSHCGISPSFVARLYTAPNRLCIRGRYDIHAERGGVTQIVTTVVLISCMVGTVTSGRGKNSNIMRTSLEYRPWNDSPLTWSMIRTCLAEMGLWRRAWIGTGCVMMTWHLRACFTQPRIISTKSKLIDQLMSHSNLSTSDRSFDGLQVGYAR